MKKYILFILVLLWTPSAFAFRADVFKGIYEVVNESNVAGDLKSTEKKYFLLDVDTLQNIWTKYADGKLPPDLEPYRDEPTILAGFTYKDFLILSFEKNAFVAETYLALATEDQRLEMQLRPGAGAELGTLEKGRISRYLLANPVPISPVSSQAIVLPTLVR